MNFQSTAQPEPATNGFPHPRFEKDGGSEKKVQSAKLECGGMTGIVGGYTGQWQSPFCDRLVYLTICFIGRSVKVLLKNGSVYTGVFHGADAEKDFGIILKMARLIQDGASDGQKPHLGSVSSAPLKTLIISAQELVQIICQDATVTSQGVSDDLQSDKRVELLTDSHISQYFHVEAERELKPWVPDEDVPECPELDDIFDGRWNSHRGWNQFEANEMLFGVKSTFDEELYTTKLEKGPMMRGRELEAIRIAKEIEGEGTKDLHVAEERGFQLHGKSDIDEETRYSSVHRGVGFDDGGYEDEEDILLDSRNTLTFGGVSVSDCKKPASAGFMMNDDAWGDNPSSLANSNVDLSQSVYNEPAWHLPSEYTSEDLSGLDSESRYGKENHIDGLERIGRPEFLDKRRPAEDVSVPGVGGTQSLLNGKENSSKGRKSANTSISDLLRLPYKMGEEGTSAGRQSGSQLSVKALGSTELERSDTATAASPFNGHVLSPSSVGSSSSGKSTLNPNAKEFKFNPNARSFKPSLTSAARPASPVSDASFYYPTGVSVMPQIPGMPGGYGIGQSFSGQQPMMFDPQFAPVQSSRAYIPQDAPQYGQQMFMGGQPRQMGYMPSYQQETHFKGRNY